MTNSYVTVVDMFLGDVVSVNVHISTFNATCLANVYLRLWLLYHLQCILN